MISIKSPSPLSKRGYLQMGRTINDIIIKSTSTFGWRVPRDIGIGLWILFKTLK